MRLEYFQLIDRIVDLDLSDRVVDLVEEGGGIVVAAVKRESPGASGGLRPGDLLVSLNDRPVQTVGEVIRVLRTIKPGDEIAVKVLRGSAEKTLSVIAGGVRPAAEFEVEEQKTEAGVLGMLLYDTRDKRVAISAVSPTSPAAAALT